jgi:hypothetical protein
MKRRSLVRVIALSTSVLILLLLVCGFAQGQKRGSTQESNKAVSSDWRYPELDKDSDKIDVGDGFKAARDGDTVDVDIPGAYSDTLERGGHTSPSLTFQLAAAVFVRVNAAPTKDAGEAMKSYYLGSKDVRQGNGKIQTEYSFRLSNGRTARIFVYFNNDYGLLGIVRTGPTSRKK